MMAWVVTAIAVTGASMGMSAYGAYQSGQTQKYNYQMQAASARQQALNLEAQKKIARQNADSNIEATQLAASQEAKRIGLKGAEVAGAATATGAAQGVGGGSVTAADIAVSNFDKQKMDEIALRYNADSRSAAYETEARNSIWSSGIQADQFRTEGGNLDYNSKRAATAGNIGAVSSILSGASSMASMGWKNTLKVN